MASKQVSLKLVVDKERKRVVFAESDYDFVDIILSFLTIPLGTVLQLLNKESQIGCMDRLYDSVEGLDVKFLQTKACKSMLLLPKNASEEQCKNLVIDIQDNVDYYICKSCNLSISNAKNTRCGSCGKERSYKISEKPKNNEGKGVFVKENLRYMISDDFRVWLSSTTIALALLDEHNIRGSTALEERNVHVGAEEAMNPRRRTLSFRLRAFELKQCFGIPPERNALIFSVGSWNRCFCIKYRMWYLIYV